MRLQNLIGKTARSSYSLQGYWLAQEISSLVRYEDLIRKTENPTIRLLLEVNQIAVIQEQIEKQRARTWRHLTQEVTFDGFKRQLRFEKSQFRFLIITRKEKHGPSKDILMCIIRVQHTHNRYIRLLKADGKTGG
jgi:hypothetical protein